MNKHIKVGYEFSTTYILTRDNRTTRKSEDQQSWAGDSDLGVISRRAIDAMKPWGWGEWNASL